MKKIIVLLSLLISFSSQAAMQDDIKTLINAKDYLGLRIYLKKKISQGLSPKDWRSTRARLISHPQVGYDLVFYWDRLKVAQKIQLTKQEIDLRKSIEDANSLMQNRKYPEAIEKYQEALVFLKNSYKNGKVPSEHQPLYYDLLEQLGRAYYSAGQFESALQAFSWIPMNYYNLRQVLFEKMWTGFRMKKFDIALGSIISQQSGFFSSYLEPESYLLKIYIFKQLCRDKEVQNLVKEIKSFMFQLKNNKYEMRDWAKQDFYTFSMLNLLVNNPNPEAKMLFKFATSDERKSEKEKIKSRLQSQFDNEKKRLEVQLEKVLGYSMLIKKTSSKELQELKDLPDSQVLSEKGFEYWTYKDQEEWTDEVGSHYYIGESQCQ